jgi:CheY-like chemotaxis protein
MRIPRFVVLPAPPPRPDAGDMEQRAIRSAARAPVATLAVPVLAPIAYGTPCECTAGTVNAAPTVLVCDADAAVLELAVSLLEGRGYRVLRARSGADLIEKAEAERPQAIVLELLIPRMSGWRAIAALKGQPDTAAIPLVILSSLSPPENMLAAEPATREAVAWLKKPVDPPELFGAVELALA